jgi:glycosyltransferase involved in cell wall biosynthesis
MNWTTGGIENVVSNILLSDEMNLYDVTLVLGNIVDDYKLDLLKKRNIKIINLKAKNTNKVMRYIFDIRKLTEIVSKEKYDVAHIHINNCYGLFFAKALKKAGCKVIAHSHNTGFGGRSFIKQCVSRTIQIFLANKCCDYFYGCSEEAIEFAFGNNLHRSKKVLRNAVDCKAFKYNDGCRYKIRDEYNIGDDVIVLGHIGHFNFQKNQRFIIDILAKLQGRACNYKAMLIGDGETKKSVINYAKERGVQDQCIFLTAMTDVAAFYSAFDIFILPSVFEGFGIVAVESQISGLPTIVSTQLPDTVKLTPMLIKCSIDEIDKWCEKIILYSERQDRIDYSEVVKVKGYDVSCMAVDVSKTYESLINGI